MAHHADEVGAHVKAEGVDEERQAEGFGETRHLRVGAEVEAARHNADEEDERHAERDALDAEFAEGKSEGNDEGKQYESLHCRVYCEEAVNPFHL